MNDLTRGRLVEALSTNLLVVAAVVAAVGGVLVWGVRRASGTGAEPIARPAHPRVLAIGLALVVVAFGVGRWLPPLAWAAP